jgi:HEAT repeat protein
LALSRIGVYAAPPLAQTLMNDDPKVRDAAAWALERIADRGLAKLDDEARAAEIAQFVKRALTHQDLRARRAAWRVFSTVATPQIVDEAQSLVTAALRDEDPVIRRFAAAALSKE